MSTLHMIRHGQASFGQANYDRLSPKGEQQARIVAKHLCRLNTVFDAVYTGTLERQQQTARAMLSAYRENRQSLPPPQALPELDEYDAAGLWRHLRGAVLSRHPELASEPDQLRHDPRAFQQLFSRIVQSWVAGEHPSNDLESWTAFRRRVRLGIGRIMQMEGAGKQVAVCTSAGPVAVAVQMATAIPDDRCADLSWQVLNASITRFRYDAQRFTLAGFNDVAGLAVEGGAALLTYR